MTLGLAMNGAQRAWRTTFALMKFALMTFDLKTYHLTFALMTFALTTFHLTFALIQLIFGIKTCQFDSGHFV